MRKKTSKKTSKNKKISGGQSLKRGKARRFDNRIFNLPVTCRSAVFADLLNNLIRAGRSQAGNNAHGQGGQGISGREIRHVDVHGGQAQQAAKGAADGRQPFVGQRGLSLALVSRPFILLRNLNSIFSIHSWLRFVNT